VEQWPTVQRPAPPDVLPIAFTEQQLAALFDASQREDGYIGGIRAHLWWAAWLSFIWCSGERLSASLAIRYEWVDLERGIVTIPAAVRKGGRRPALYHLWPWVVQRMQAIAQPQREMWFPWPFTLDCYWYRFGRILRRAGIPDDRWRKTHALRKTHATFRYIAGQDATAALMHSDPATTIKHYLDRSMLPAPEPLFNPWQPPDPPRAA